MKLTGDPENLQKCFNCNNWTAEKYLIPVQTVGRTNYFCAGCYAQLMTRNEVLEQIKDEVEVSEKAKRAKESRKSEHPSGEGTTGEVERPFEE